MDIVVRVYAATLDLDAALRPFPERLVIASWRVGDRSLPKARPATDTGFNLSLAEEEDGDAAQELAIAELKALVTPLRALAEREGVSVDVDFALYVYPVVPRALCVSSELLQLICDAGATLVVTAYPCADA